MDFCLPAEDQIMILGEKHRNLLLKLFMMENWQENGIKEAKFNEDARGRFWKGVAHVGQKTAPFPRLP